MYNRFPKIPVLSVKEHVTYVLNNMLNSFAAEKGYDSIISACSYSTSTIPTFRAEALRSIAVRDAVWVAVLEALEDASKTPAEILDSLPALTWD